MLGHFLAIYSEHLLPWRAPSNVGENRRGLVNRAHRGSLDCLTGKNGQTASSFDLMSFDDDHLQLTNRRSGIRQFSVSWRSMRSLRTPPRLSRQMVPLAALGVGHGLIAAAGNIDM